MASLPSIQQTRRQRTPTLQEHKEFLALLAPGPVHLPSDNIRNPITGTMATYSAYVPGAAPGGSASKQRKPVSTFHRNIHEKSIFEVVAMPSHSNTLLSVYQHTGPHHSYFIIHPQWTSEATGVKRMRTMERRHYAWDNRPAHTGPPPLIDYILPQLHKKRDKDSLLRQTLQSAKASQVQQSQELTDRDKLRASMPQMERSNTWAPATRSSALKYYKPMERSAFPC